MVIELFTLSDGAFNYNGKLTIVGALTTINIDNLPARVKLSIAMRIRVYSEDMGEKPMVISFISPDQKKLPVDISVNLDIKETPEPVSYITFAAEVQGLPLDSEGVYQIEVYIQDEKVGEYPFNVKKVNK